MQACATAATCPRPMSFGIVTTKFGGSRPRARARQRRHEQIERPQAARVQLLRHRLDADADERRQCSRRVTRGDFLGHRLRMAVFFSVRPDAVAVLEVDAEVLDRLARELVDNARCESLRRARPGRAEGASALANVLASGAYSSSTAARHAPILAAESALKRCAPPYRLCTGWRSPRLSRISRGRQRRWSCEAPARIGAQRPRVSDRVTAGAASCGVMAGVSVKRLRPAICRVAERTEQQRHVVVRRTGLTARRRPRT